jgi:hypothetical protein
MLPFKRPVMRRARPSSWLGIIVVSAMTSAVGCAGSQSSPVAPGSAAITPASHGTTATAGAKAAPHAIGSVVGTIGLSDWNGVIGDAQGVGFTVIDDIVNPNTDADESTLQTYGAAGNVLTTLSAGSFTGDCGAADIVNKAGRLLITMLATSTPAQGVNPGTSSLTMTARNASTGATVWTATLVNGQAQGALSPCPPGATRELYGFESTLDGQWGVIEIPGTSNSDAVDLTTGKLYPRSDLEGVLGNDVVTGSGSTGDNMPTSLTVTAPGSWPQLGAAAGSGADGGNPQLSGDVREGDEFSPSNFAVTGYASDGGSGNGPSAVSTPDGSYLVTLHSDGNGAADERGYALPSLRQLWSSPVPQYYSDVIAAASDSAVLIMRPGDVSGTSATLLALDPQTGKTEWTTKIDSGTVCDMTSAQVLVKVGDQLAVLSATTGKQLSYGQDPYVDQGGAECPDLIGTGSAGIADDGSQIVQVLTP